MALDSMLECSKAIEARLDGLMTRAFVQHPIASKQHAFAMQSR